MQEREERVRREQEEKRLAQRERDAAKREAAEIRIRQKQETRD